MVKRYQDGEVIDLVWPDGDMDEVYLRGWMDEEKARALLAAHYPEYRIYLAYPWYGRWSREIDEDGERACVLRTYGEPGRGRFKIMVAAAQPMPPTAYDEVVPETNYDTWWRKVVSLFTRG